MSGRLKMKRAKLAVGYAKNDYWILISTKPASNNFRTKVQLGTKSDAFLSTQVLLSLIKIFSTCCTVFLKLRYRDIVEFRTKNRMDGEKLVIDSLQTINFHFSRCDVENIVWSFSMPLCCNKHLPGKIPFIALRFLGCLSLRVPSGVASPQYRGGQIFCFSASKIILFSTPRLLTQNDKKRKKSLGKQPLCRFACVYARTPTIFF